MNVKILTLVIVLVVSLLCSASAEVCLVIVLISREVYHCIRGLRADLAGHAMMILAGFMYISAF
ncbi:hypothetical protein E1301_Tti004158 [Triplophysa tibetana]|uniref:Uncharacterized protein n=1 Tax=Triplophysa tibetana TaxID=1572043 RepID=A0A5A9NMI9_9TELE|nr:hypothetical protein E1301_Tti004158 [Triplophysa tibetana]